MQDKKYAMWKLFSKYYLSFGKKIFLIPINFIGINSVMKSATRKCTTGFKNLILFVIVSKSCQTKCIVTRRPTLHSNICSLKLKEFRDEFSASICTGWRNSHITNSLMLYLIIRLKLHIASCIGELEALIISCLGSA